MASTETTSSNKKLRVLLIPFFASSHIGPFTELAVSLATARPHAVEATVAVTPANASIVRSLLQRHENGGTPAQVATYPFPAVDGLPRGVENLGAAAQADAWRIDVAAVSDTLMRPVQETLIWAQSPDALVTDVHFMWNADVCDELGVPCVTYNVVGAFSTLAMRHLTLALVSNSNTNIEPEPEAVSVPRFPAPEIRVPTVELPEYLRSQERVDYSTYNRLYEVQGDCFGVAVNTSLDLEEHYCEMYAGNGYAKRAYMLGPLSLRLPSSPEAGDSRYTDWLDSKPSRSVVYVCFGSLAHVSDAQLDELALGLEASGMAFLWVVRADKWSPPERWHERVGGRGMVATAWAPQRAILAHRAVGAFVTHCGWNSVLETVAAGVPVLTWPIVFEQFITERLLTEVLGIGERLWPDGAGVRSTRYEENEVIPAHDVARALKTFMQPGGPGDAARSRVMGLAAKVHAAVAEGGSSDRDLHRLIDDLMEAAGAGKTTM
ncbi:hypothetical protein CFC21_015053 [Triticum aestivum]|uniref:Glycosyltransferase n=2 Tax=Triticum aestivum TaxID=4565 RepID=A0A9R1DW77_WHEAT|nr:scopoletin glucosyltransferase-like [Triticum aestivum]KAF6998981.1 hypothetical protein CFC21_015053 [Triticum aestivum]